MMLFILILIDLIKFISAVTCSNFANCCNGASSVTISSSVTSIGKQAFFGCAALTSVTIGDSVTSIGSQAFYGCTALTSVIIGNSVISIGNQAFYGCAALTSVTIGNSVATISDYAFYRCTSLTSVTIPSSVATIGCEAFSHCSSMTSVTIPTSVTTIGESAFYDCSSLTSVTIPSSITSIGYDAFYNCAVPCIFADSDLLRKSGKGSCCPAGSIINDMSCDSSCFVKGYYYHLNKCEQCPYLRTSSITPYECSQLYIGLHQGGIIAIELFLVSMFLLSFMFLRDKNHTIDHKAVIGLFLYCAIPVLDVLTDLAYILQNVFYNEAILAVVLLFFVSSWFFYFKLLWVRGIRAKFWICPIPQCLFFAQYDNIFKLTLTGVASIPFIIINLPVLLPVTLLGVTLFSMKSLPIIGVYNMWLYLYSGVYNETTVTYTKNNKIYASSIIDKTILNESIYTEILLESLPQMVVQIVNNVLIGGGSWSAISYVSVIISGLNILSGIYRILYYKYYLSISLVDVPIKVEVFGITLLDMENDYDHIKANINKNNNDKDIEDFDIEFTNIDNCHGDDHDDDHATSVELTQITTNTKKSDKSSSSSFMQSFKNLVSKAD